MQQTRHIKHGNGILNFAADTHKIYYWEVKNFAAA
jgi:hypothetical protein